MFIRLVISDAMWDRIEPLMPAGPVRGRRWADHRGTLKAIAWTYRTDSPWRDLPDEFGPFQTAHKRLIRWAADGTWEMVLASVLAVADADDDIDDLRMMERSITVSKPTRLSEILKPGMGSVHIAILPRALRSTLIERKSVTYYADLTPYTYGSPERPALNVGWLSADEPYTRGVVAECVVDALKALCATRVNQMRGLHFCEFCDAFMPHVKGGINGEEEILLGSAEIHFGGDSEVVYAAPNLIVHYVLEHSYCPPEEFCSAAVNAAGMECADRLTLPE
ncbi:transposase [Streptomyces sp. HF10]|uniref:transposase n=1 Tax=Streptomyces sp. HF10 TaxID=2692233 RepID=UPI002E2C13B5|nr:transposase [Streptomyces sp. HF10]